MRAYRAYSGAVVEAAPGGAAPVQTKTATIDNTGGAAQTDYQVKVPLTWSAGMRADFGDVRFPDAATPTSYWIDPDSILAGVSATAYVKLSVLAAASVPLTIQYGGGLTTTTGSGVSTFDLFDDFSAGGDTFDVAKWRMDKTNGYQRMMSDNFRITRKVGFLSSNNADHNTQGIAVHNGVLYAGSDGASESVNSTIFRYDIPAFSVKNTAPTTMLATGAPSSFPGPNHCVNMGMRWDTGHEGNLLAGPGPIANNKVWEIDPVTGTCLRKWQMGGVVDFAGANSSVFPDYYAPGQLIVMTNDSVGGTHRLRIVNVNSDEGATGGLATFSLGDYWDFTHPRLLAGRRQGFKYVDGFVYFMLDDANPDSDGGTLFKISLGAPGSHVATIVAEYNQLPGDEREDLAYDRATGKWYFIEYYGSSLFEFEFSDRNEGQFVSENHTGTARQAYVSSLNTYGFGYKMVARWRGNDCYPALGWSDLVTQGTLFDCNSGVLAGRLSMTTDNVIFRRKNSGTQTNNNTLNTTASYTASFREYEVHRVSSALSRLVIDGVVIDAPTTSNPSGAMSACIGSCSGTGSSYTDLDYVGEQTVRFAAVAKTQAVEPVVTGA